MISVVSTLMHLDKDPDRLTESLATESDERFTELLKRQTTKQSDASFFNKKREGKAFTYIVDTGANEDDDDQIID